MTKFKVRKERVREEGRGIYAPELRHQIYQLSLPPSPGERPVLLPPPPRHGALHRRAPCSRRRSQTRSTGGGGGRRGGEGRRGRPFLPPFLVASWFISRGGKFDRLGVGGKDGGRGGGRGGGREGGREGTDAGGIEVAFDVFFFIVEGIVACFFFLVLLWYVWFDRWRGGRRGDERVLPPSLVLVFGEEALL